MASVKRPVTRAADWVKSETLKATVGFVSWVIAGLVSRFATTNFVTETFLIV